MPVSQNDRVRHRKKSKNKVKKKFLFNMKISSTKDNAICPKGIAYQHQNKNNDALNTYRQQKMASMPPHDLQLIRHPLRRKYKHHRNTQVTNDERQLEALPNSWYLYPERGALDFFAPCHVVRKQMGKDSGWEMDREPAEEEKAKARWCH